MQVIKVTDGATREQIEQAIRALRAKQDRMPRAWEKRRAEVGAEIDQLVEEWLAAGA